MAARYHAPASLLFFSCYCFSLTLACTCTADGQEQTTVSQRHSIAIHQVQQHTLYSKLVQSVETTYSNLSLHVAGVFCSTFVVTCHQLTLKIQV